MKTFLYIVVTLLILVFVTLFIYIIVIFLITIYKNQTVEKQTVEIHQSVNIPKEQSKGIIVSKKNSDSIETILFEEIEAQVDGSQSLNVYENTDVQNAQDRALTEPKEQDGSIEIEVEPGETMRVLGQKYYGHGVFWVYIFEENEEIIGSPDNVYVGLKLRIAPASKYAIDPKNESSRRKAQKREMQLFGEFSSR